MTLIVNMFQMLPELRATLFGTNPNRKHID